MERTPIHSAWQLRFVAALLPACVLAVELHAQTFRAGRIDLDTLGVWDGLNGAYVGSSAVQPLSIVNASPIPQPLRLYTGPGGVLLGLELSGSGDVSLPLRLGVGNGIAASTSERIRIGSITGSVATGVTIDMRFADSTTGLSIRDVGESGSIGAGIAITSAANGTGVGIRIGGPTGSGRPTLLTGVDVTGGTGLRYNSLSAGGGKGIDIGSTMPPNIGIEVTTAGSGHIAGIFRANTQGLGLLGISRSGSFVDPDHRPRTGVFGYAATASNIAADVVTGVRGEALRSGTGGTNTLSIGVEAEATSIASSHGGLVVGLRARAATSGAGTTAAISALVEADTGRGRLALAVRRGDTYIGSTFHDRPAGGWTFTEGLLDDNLSTTWMYDARISGGLTLRGRTSASATILGPNSGQWKYRWPSEPPDVGFTLGVIGRQNDTFQLGWMPVAASVYLQFEPGDQIINQLGNRNVVVASSSQAGSRLIGMAVPNHPVIVHFINIANQLTIVHEDIGAPAEQRLRSPFGNDIIITDEGAITFWYDVIGQRWRVISYIP